LRASLSTLASDTPNYLTLGPILSNMTTNLAARFIFTALAVLVLAAGSILGASIVLGNTPDPTRPSEAAEGLQIFFAIVWPIILLIVWVCGTIALALDGRAGKIAEFLGVVVATGIAVWLVAVLMSVIVATLHLHVDFPLRGLSAVLVVLLCVGLNVGALWYAWQYLLRGTLGPQP